MFRFCFLILGFALLGTLGRSILEGANPQWKLIGVYNGHSYFYDNTPKTWEDSKSYCAALGMKLAEIYSLDNLRMLQNYHAMDAEFNRNAGYWLAGRDSKTPSQFVWDDSGNQMTTDLQWVGFNGPYTGVTYNNEGLLSGPMDTRFGVICQT